LTFFLSCALAGTGKTAGAERISGDAERVLGGVPFHPQQTYQCGPAALASVLNFWNVPVTPEEIAKDIYSPGARGTLNLDMAEYARNRGLRATASSAGIGDLRRSIDAGQPVIVLVDLGFWIYEKNHYMVAVGYSEDSLIAHSGRESFKRIPVDDFLNSWEKTGFWALFIQPQ
jgi:ABC-type bacteriocin/lantibiotic exporter with double-glycine peptidase domain